MESFIKFDKTVWEKTKTVLVTKFDYQYKIDVNALGEVEIFQCVRPSLKISGCYSVDKVFL